MTRRRKEMMNKELPAEYLPYRLEGIAKDCPMLVPISAIKPVCSIC